LYDNDDNNDVRDDESDDDGCDGGDVVDGIGGDGGNDDDDDVQPVYNTHFYIVLTYICKHVVEAVVLMWGSKHEIKKNVTCSNAHMPLTFTPWIKQYVDWISVTKSQHI
jgi:hypothetical protein